MIPDTFYIYIAEATVVLSVGIFWYLFCAGLSKFIKPKEAKE